jgi:DNA-binding transcriptional MerR regulator
MGKKEKDEEKARAKHKEGKEDKERRKELTLRELAEEAGVPERTIRFYISRGLVDPPLRGGRGAAYGAKHKDQLEGIRRLQAKGMMLSQIAHARAAEGARTEAGTEGENTFRPLVAAETRPGEMVWFKADGTIDESSVAAAPPARQFFEPSPPTAQAIQALPEPTVWRSYRVAPDATVMLRAGASPWRTRALVDALRRFAAEVGESIKKENKGE